MHSMPAAMSAYIIPHVHLGEFNPYHAVLAVAPAVPQTPAVPQITVVGEGEHPTMYICACSSDSFVDVVKEAWV